jgi:hypothetical protein
MGFFSNACADFEERRFLSLGRVARDLCERFLSGVAELYTKIPPAQSDFSAEASLFDPACVLPLHWSRPDFERLGALSWLLKKQAPVRRAGGHDG